MANARKFHINGDGVAARCDATVGKCPFGGFADHYESEEEAKEATSVVNEGEVRYEMARKMTSSEALKSFGIKDTTGDRTELEAIFHLMDKEIESENLKLKPKLYSPRALGHDKKSERIRDAIKFALGEKDKGNSVNLVAETESSFYVWSKNTKTLDVMKIDKMLTPESRIHVVDRTLSNYRRIVEVKDLTKGAQLSTTNLDYSKDRFTFNLSSEVPFREKISRDIAEWNPVTDSYTNKELNLSPEEALEYFVRDYSNQGATELVYKTKDNTFKKIHLQTPWIKSDASAEILEESKEKFVREAVEKLKRDGIEVAVKIRANNIQNSSKPKKADTEAFRKNYGSLFKDGVAKEKFTLKDLVVSGEGPVADIRKSRREFDTYTQKSKNHEFAYVRLGDFYFRTKEDLSNDQVFDIKDFKRCRPHITGEIKEK